MSFVVGAIVTGSMYAIDKIGSGINAMNNADDVATAKVAAGQILEDKMDILHDQSVQTANTGAMQFQSSIRDLFKKVGSAYSKSNMATVSTIQRQKQDEMRQLVDTRNMVTANANLAFRKGEMSALEAYENTITQIDAVPDTFMEGAFG